jgi:predicted Zn-dependent peptidase
MSDINTSDLNTSDLNNLDTNSSDTNTLDINTSDKNILNVNPLQYTINESTPDFWQMTWANGLTVLAEQRPHSRSFSAGFFVKTGSSHEPHGLEGAAHFLEHLMFKGNAKMDALELNRRFDALGADYNAFTDHEMTAYHAVVLANQAEALLELLFELTQPQLNPAEVELERQVILEEIEMYDDSPDSRLFDVLRLQYYRDHPHYHSLAHPILGTRQSVASLTVQQLEQHRQTHYSPDQQVLVLCGNFGKTQILSCLERLITPTPPAVSPSRPLAVLDRAAPIGPVRLSPSRPLALSLERSATFTPDPRLKRMHLGLMLPAPLLSDPLSGAAQVLAEILGGDTGRLYWALMDNGLADEVAFTCSESPLEGHFEGYLACDPTKVSQVWQVFGQVLEQIPSTLEPAELERAKRKLILGLALSEETAYGRLFNLGTDYVQQGARVTLQDHQNRIRSVTLEQINQLLERFPLVPVALASLGPLETWDWGK